MYSTLAPRLLTWGMTSAGLGLGLIVAAFVGKDTPIMILWGAGLLAVGGISTIGYFLLRSKGNGQ